MRACCFSNKGGILVRLLFLRSGEAAFNCCSSSRVGLLAGLLILGQVQAAHGAAALWTMAGCPCDCCSSDGVRMLMAAVLQIGVGSLHVCCSSDGKSLPAQLLLLRWGWTAWGHCSLDGSRLLTRLLLVSLWCPGLKHWASQSGACFRIHRSLWLGWLESQCLRDHN